MLQAIKLTKNSSDVKAVKQLYEIAFPKNERVNFELLLECSETYVASFEILVIYDGELFVGFVIILNSENISHLLFFAVDEKLRSKGYGSEILKAVHNSKLGQIFLADVEKPDAKSDNNEQREKRISFYYRNGYKMTDVEYSWKGENYMIMSRNGDISKEDYKAFWKRRADMLERVLDEKSFSEQV